MEKNTAKEFRDAVLDVVRTIPRGRVTSYGAIARAIGHPNHSRLVGHTLARCGDEIPPVPAHRVTDSQGRLSGNHHFGTPGRMQQLLEAEGIVVEHNRIRQFKTRFWDPLLEIEPESINP